MKIDSLDPESPRYKLIFIGMNLISGSALLQRYSAYICWCLTTFRNSLSVLSLSDKQASTIPKRKP